MNRTDQVSTLSVVLPSSFPFATTPVEPAEAVSTSPLRLVVAVLVALVVAWVCSLAVAALVRRATRTSTLGADLGARTHRATLALLTALALHLAVTRAAAPAGWRTVVEHLLVVGAVAAGAWLVGSAAAAVTRASADRELALVPPDPRAADRARAQLRAVRLGVLPVLVPAAVGLALLTVPGTRATGTVVLGLAALAAVALVVAARGVLADLAAGARLAFGDGVRVDDVVVVEGQWGRVERVGAVDVTVHLWDDRRLVVPASVVTSTVVESWSRAQDGLVGAVELDLDWTVPVDAVRAELERLLLQEELWDGRVGVLQVVDAVGGTVRVRALLSATDAPTLDDLRCAVREGLLGWVQQHGRDALPRTRHEQVGPAPVSRPVAQRPVRAQGAETQAFDLADQRARQFTGSLEGLGRARAFTGPGAGVVAARAGAAIIAPSDVTPAPAPRPAAAPRRSASSSPVDRAPAPQAAPASGPSAEAPVIVVGRGADGASHETYGASPATPTAQYGPGAYTAAPAEGYGAASAQGYDRGPRRGAPQGPTQAPTHEWTLGLTDAAATPPSVPSTPAPGYDQVDATQVLGARPTVERRSTRREMRP